MSRFKDRLIYILFWFLKFPILYFCCKRARAILKDWNDVSIQQLKLLMDIVSVGDKSKFGVDYKFFGIKSVEQFKKNINIASYERVYPYIKELICGNSKALFNADISVREYIATSGTGGIPKILPVTKEYIRRVRNFWILWGTFVFKDHPELIGHRIFHMVSNENYFSDSSFMSSLTQATKTYNTCRDTTGVISSKIPGFIRDGFRIPSFVSDIRHHKLRFYCVLRFSCTDESLCFLVGVTPYNFILLFDIMNEYLNVLLSDLKNGGISSCAFDGLTDEDKSLLEQNKRYFKKDLVSYRRILNLVNLSSNKQLQPQDLWPKVSLIACWSQAQFQPICSKIKELYGCKSIRDLGLISSEGSYSVPIQDNSESGLLNLDAAFYEFIPEEEYYDKVEETQVEYSSDIKTLLAHEIQIGKRYFMVVTTYSGLYRYDQKDLIECMGHYKNIPLIKFISKVSMISDMTGEKLTASQVALDCQYLIDKYNLEFFYMSVHPVLNPRGCYYELLVPEGVLNDVDFSSFSSDFDSKMSELNCIFKEHIEACKIKPTRIVIKNQDFWNSLKERKSTDRYKHPYIVRY